MNKKIIIACSKKWFFESTSVKNYLKKNKVTIIRDKNKLSTKILRKIDPNIIFFPHWSYKVSKNITNNYNCICFHTAPLPYGRGGSPLQNLIKRNFKRAPVCALKMTDKIDAGPIFLKKFILLDGSLDQIFNRISNTIIKMIESLNKKKIVPKKQRGHVVFFKRIKKEESEIKKEKNISQVYNKIRMLDSKEYPRAYLKIKNFQIFLYNAKLKKKSLSCNAKIIKIKN